jgi:hypothetical protein
MPRQFAAVLAEPLGTFYLLVYATHTAAPQRCHAERGNVHHLGRPAWPVLGHERRAILQLAFRLRAQSDTRVVSQHSGGSRRPGPVVSLKVSLYRLAGDA